jgi:hypothetical protein
MGHLERPPRGPTGVLQPSRDKQPFRQEKLVICQSDGDAEPLERMTVIFPSS